ncbi:iron uptake system protein EfeO [Demequina sp.]|uniref:iron uptake system protein EfeO n=1 Tax=Demequina sp. TaxID=2050685 RepID=UPI0025BF3887|nr:iron uptake system protein EfeO [Demequina sp.]
MITRSGWARACAVPVAALLLAACTGEPGVRDVTVSVTSTDDACAVSRSSTPAGNVVFSLKNDGSQATGFRVYEQDGTAVVAAVENVGPGASSDLVVNLTAGDYVTACDPGMDGDEIRRELTATEAGAAATPTGEHAEALHTASADYLAYVRAEIDTLMHKTEAFAEALASGDDETAKAMYADSRVHWLRIEPIAAHFGDLVPLLDLREADLGPNEQWLGWHHAEKLLWPPAEGYTVDQATRAELADRLVSDTANLQSRVSAGDFTVEAFQIGNGAKELLDDVAATKITGDEEIWSGTDLWDIQASIDGARRAFESLKPVVIDRDPKLVAELDERFAAAQSVLSAHGSIAEGFTLYPDLTSEQVLELSRTIEALSEPLSRLTAAAVL